jgi:hypothetical protein
MATLENIQAKLKKLQAQAEVLIAKRAHSVLNNIRKLMDENGLTTSDIDAHSPTAKKRGRPVGSTAQPKSAKAVKTRSAKAKSAKASANGKLPAKYRNPKSGATWSGWARPPIWIKDVKDRTKFLIDGSDAGEVSPAPAASKKVAAKKVARKNAAVKSKGVKAVKVVKALDTTAKKAAAKKPAAKKVTAKKASTKRAPAKKSSASRKSSVAKTNALAGQGSSESALGVSVGRDAPAA